MSGQEVTSTAAPRTITANSACAIDCDDHHESYPQQDTYDADVDDETTVFLSQILNEAANEQVPDSSSEYLSPDYTTTRASAMMMMDELIIMEDKQKVTANIAEGHKSPIDHTRVCALEASVLPRPTQAETAAPGARSVNAGSYPHEKSCSIPTSRKGLVMGGG